MNVPGRNAAAGTDDVLYLRRTFHSFPRQWNDNAKISINGVALGMWFIPMGTLDEEYSLRVEEITMMTPPPVEEGSKGQGHFEISIEPLTMWRDISYEMCRT